MGLYDKNSVVPANLKLAATKMASMIESTFNTKVYDYGIAVKGTSDFDFLLLNTSPFSNTKYIWYFLVPIDDEDNIITNDYYEKSKNLNKGIHNSITSIIYAREFQQILKKDSAVCNFIQSRWNAYVYSNGALKVKKYKSGENIVPNAGKIEDLKYRFFRFFMTHE